MSKHSCSNTALGLCLVVLAALPASSVAQDPPDEWQWQATVYAWLPDIEGQTQFPSGAGGPSILVDAETLLDNLDFTFMATLQVRKGDWGAFTDVVYLDEGVTRQASREFSLGQQALPAGVTLDAEYDLKSWVWTLAGTRALTDDARNTTDFLFGARMFDLEQALDWNFNGDIGGLGLPGRSGGSKVSMKQWDAIIGLRGQARIGADERWLLPWHFDVGAGDSDLTWQAVAGLGYQFDWGALALTYRHLDYDLGSGAPVSDMEFSGPLLGASFQW